MTYDVDLCYRRTPDNLDRLAAALGTLNLTLRGADFLGYLEPVGTYEDLTLLQLEAIKRLREEEGLR